MYRNDDWRPIGTTHSRPIVTGELVLIMVQIIGKPLLTHLYNQLIRLARYFDAVDDDYFHLKGFGKSGLMVVW